MTDTETLTPEVAARVAEIGTADVVVALTSGTVDDQQAGIAAVRAALGAIAGSPRTVVVHSAGVPPPADAGAAPESVASAPLLALLALPGSVLDQAPRFGQDAAETYRTVFALSASLQARACALVGSTAARLRPEALRRLIQPVLEQDIDLVAPCYRCGRFDALLASGIVSPLYRALYGRRLLFPIGGDFGLSKRMMERCLAPVGARPKDGGSIWLASEAAAAGFRIGQAHLGVPFPSGPDPGDASSALAAVVGPIFADMERKAPAWQRVRGSSRVPTFGTGSPCADEAATVDVSRMIESFRLGYANLREVWSAVLPPATLLELKRLTVLAPDAFRLADDLWARIVYDFALAHRLRVMNREHLLGAMTPAYLAWVASYVLEVQHVTPAAVALRLERLAGAYEAQKPYLVSRWRWPDRFNP